MSSPAALYAPDALRTLEKRAAVALDGDAFVLMQRAGLAAWQCLLQHWPQAQRIVVVCGPGNNGGDGYVLATHAHAAGRDVRVVHLPAHVARSVLARRASDVYRAAGGRVVDASIDALAGADVIVDAIFGIGLDRRLDAQTSAMIDAINAPAVPVLALDVPSGVDAARGCVAGTAVIATRTLQFIAPSCGLATGRALAHVGQLQVHALDIADGCFEQVPVAAWQLRSSSLAEFLHPRGRDSHKGDNGHVLCIGGDHGSGGAIILCAQAALRCGAGLVSVATRGAHLASLLARVPEAMVHALDRTDIENVLFERANVVAIGTGLGQAPWAQALFDGALASGKPLVLDADALNLLARQPRRLPSGTILTPHPGEAARLLGCDTRQVQDDRYAAARRLVEVFGCVVVLKGAGTVVAAPGEIPRVIDAGNPGMGVGGMGDLLTGVIAALSAQGLPAFDAACCGALLHATAGDAAAGEGGERGLLPSDLLTWLRRLANPGSRP